MKKYLIVSFFLLEVIKGSSVSAQTPTPTDTPRPAYKITDLGEGRANAINDRGQVTGSAAHVANAVIWSGPSPVLIPAAPPAAPPVGTRFPSEGYDINNKGVIVGPASGTGPSLGFKWVPNANDLDGTLGATESDPTYVDGRPYSIADNFDIVAGERQVNFATKAYRLSGTTYTDYADGFRSFGIGVNDWGKVVGEKIATFGDSSQAVCFNCSVCSNCSTDGTAVVLGSAGGNHTTASAINNNGNVVGGGESSGNTTFRGFFHDGSWHTVAPFDNDEESFANALNDSNLVVGESWTSSTSRAIRWTTGNHTEDLNTLIAPETGWYLERATGINSCGQIVGWGVLNSTNKSFLLSPSFHAMVFDPDPITSSNNSDITEIDGFALNRERVCVPLLGLSSISESLDGELVTVEGDFGTPNTVNEPSRSYTYFLEEESKFIQANAYYHIDSAVRYLQSLDPFVFESDAIQFNGKRPFCPVVPLHLS